MHLLIRRPDGGYDQRAAFGFFRDDGKPSPYDLYYLVLDTSKTRLVRHYAYRQYGNLDLRQSLNVLIADPCTEDWHRDDHGFGSVSWLPTDAEGRPLPAALLAKCREADEALRVDLEGEIRTPADADRLLWIAGGFHDGRIESLDLREDGTVSVDFVDLWGCRISLWFTGDVFHAIPDEDDQDYWYSASIRMADGFITLIDDDFEDDEPLPDDPDSGYTWFRARRMGYRIEPFPD